MGHNRVVVIQPIQEDLQSIPEFHFPDDFGFQPLSLRSLLLHQIAKAKLGNCHPVGFQRFPNQLAACPKS
jgi:hypothetical protein